MDWGQEAFFDTIDALIANNLSVIGVGKDIKEARKAAIIDIQDIKIAFLAYNTILPMNYWADNDRPGCAPMRAFTLYEPIEHDQPGTPARTHTFAHREDLKALIDDIHTARQEADIVILSLHWGIHFIPAVIADYQREVAHRAIDNGADLILGHHAHILKGIEVYKNKAIFYSMANFAIEPPSAFVENLFERESHKTIADLNPGWQPEKKYPMPPDTRHSIIVACDIEKTRIREVTFRPVYINDAFQPEILKPADSKYDDIVAYIQRISEEQNLSVSLRASGDVVEVLTT
jgi:poly-gamma-glutamate synthesis protein (capsule biosynthesis protein)